ncbi:MAG: molybdopterin-dependent oxidoreductase, partial [Sphingomonadales bacterium]
MDFNRRTVIAGAGVSATLALPVVAERMADLHLPDGPSARPLAPRFPQKGEMIVQRIRPPLLETPFDVFDQGTITPNDRHFVRWHWNDFPTIIDVSKYRLKVRGAVKAPVELTLDQVLRAGEHVEFVAVNQCAGNSRGMFQPRMPGAQWGNGAMSNARWRGVRLRDLLDKAGVGDDAKHVRFAGLDTPSMDGAPQFIKSIPIDIARRDDTIVAFAMNGEAMPLLNGFPLRLVVPGWFSTYWVKMLSDIEVLTGEDDSFFMAKSYRMPTVPVKPGDKDFPTVPVAAMPPRSFVTSHADGATIGRGQPLKLRGIAMGGNAGVKTVVVTTGGAEHAATLESEDGPYGFRRWTVSLSAPTGDLIVGTRCTNAKGVVQPDVQAWNPSGYARDVVEHITL